MTHSTDTIDLRQGTTLALTDPTQLAVFTFLARYSGPTLDGYRFDMKLYLGWCMAHDLKPLEAQRGHLELYTRWLESTPSATTGQRFAQATVARRLGTVLLFYKYASIDDYIPKNPAAAVTRPRVDHAQQKTPFLPPLAYASVLTEAKKMGAAEHATVALMGMLGLRVAEACSLNVESVHVEGGYEVITFVGKGNKAATGTAARPGHARRPRRDRRPGLRPAAAQPLAEPDDPEERRPDHPQGVSLRKMQVAARHANPSTTVRYDKMSGSLATHAAHEVAGYLSSMSGS